MKSFRSLFLLFVTLFLATACSPKFDWRDARSTEAPFTVLMPGKPLGDSKDMQLAGMNIKMGMLATEVAGISFAVGSIRVEDAGKAGLLMEAMKNGMIRNVQGTAETTRISPSGNIEVHGKLKNGTPVLMVGRFLIHTPWVYQIVMLGDEKAMKQDVIDTFMTSFKTN